MDNDKNKNALYEKPKRIIQNQVLIQLLIILAVAVPIPLGGVIFKLVFCVIPKIVIPSILVLWIISSVSFTVWKIQNFNRFKRKS